MGWAVGEPTGLLRALLMALAPPVPVWGGSAAARTAPGWMTGKFPDELLTQMGLRSPSFSKHPTASTR